MERAHLRTERWALKLLHNSRIGHLATSTKVGKPHTVPVCYAFDGHTIYVPIDEKPKRVGPERLRRVRNIAENPRGCLVVDVYSEDWRKLRYVIVQASANIIHRGSEHKRAVALLRRKYRQYRTMSIEARPIIRLRPVKVISWRSGLEM